MTYIRPCKTTRISDDFADHVARGSGLPGVDFTCPTGERIWATKAGVVTRAGRDSVMGLNVRIRHSDGSNSYYLHLSRLDVRNGEKVEQRETIGLSGSTGRSTGPHLHFSLTSPSGKLVNPLPLLKNGGGDTPAPKRRTIKLGARGEDVKYLQKILRLRATGFFGVATRQAVIKFQKRRLLAADGIVGPSTWKAIG